MREGEDMATEFTGTGDPARSMALLWRTPSADSSRPGPKAALGVDRIVTSAVRLADREGLAALSMRRVAAELGVGAMSLYTHVPGKGELVDLMLDAVLGELYPDEDVVRSGGWRDRLGAGAGGASGAFPRPPRTLPLGTRRGPKRGAYGTGVNVRWRR